MKNLFYRITQDIRALYVVVVSCVMAFVAVMAGWWLQNAGLAESANVFYALGAFVGVPVAIAALAFVVCGIGTILHWVYSPVGHHAVRFKRDVLDSYYTPCIVAIYLGLIIAVWVGYGVSVAVHEIGNHSLGNNLGMAAFIAGCLLSTPFVLVAFFAVIGAVAGPIVRLNRFLATCKAMRRSTEASTC